MRDKESLKRKSLNNSQENKQPMEQTLDQIMNSQTQNIEDQEKQKRKCRG